MLSPDLSSIQSKSPKASLKSPFKKLDDVSQTTFSNSENQDGCGDVLNQNFKSIKDNNRNKYNSNEMYLAESYEDILSTAIINKVWLMVWLLITILLRAKYVRVIYAYKYAFSDILGCNNKKKFLC